MRRLAGAFGLVLLVALPARALDQALFFQGLQRLRDRVSQDLLAQDLSRPASRYLLPGSEPRLFLLRPDQARGTAVVFHDLGASPSQTDRLCRALNAARFHCFAPRLPGHAWIDPGRRPLGEDVPTASQAARYETFLSQIQQDLDMLQAPLHAIGIGGGANLALSLGQKADLVSVAAIDPLLGPDYPAAIGWNLFTGLSFAPIDALLSPLGYARPEKDATPIRLDQAFALSLIGRRVGRIEGRLILFTRQDDGSEWLKGSDPVKELMQRLNLDRHQWFHQPDARPKGRLDQLTAQLIRFFKSSPDGV